MTNKRKWKRFRNSQKPKKSEDSMNTELERRRYFQSLADIWYAFHEIDSRMIIT